MRKYYCLNQIAKEGLERFSEEYERTEDICEADGILVRSASMHEMELPPKNCLPWRGRVRGSTISRWNAARSRASSCSIRRAQMQTVSRSW